MQDKLKVVELDRRPIDVRNKSLSTRDEQGRLDRHLRAVLDDRRRAFEQGFVAAISMMARGTRDFGHEEPTAPYPIIDPATLEVD